MLFETCAWVGIDIGLRAQHIPTVRWFRNALMLKNIYVAFPELGYSSLARWRGAIPHNIILTIPCEK